MASSWFGSGLVAPREQSYFLRTGVLTPPRTFSRSTERNAPSASAFRRRGASSKLRSLGGLLLLRSLQLTVSTPAVGIRRPTAREYASPARQHGNTPTQNNCATTHAANRCFPNGGGVL